LQTFKKLLRELVVTATDYISNSSTSAGAFTTTASKTTKSGLWELDQALSATNGRIKAHSSQMTIKIEVSSAVSSSLIISSRTNDLTILLHYLSSTFALPSFSPLLSHYRITETTKT
jgi:hypothetical protein